MVSHDQRKVMAGVKEFIGEHIAQRNNFEKIREANFTKERLETCVKGEKMGKERKPKEGLNKVGERK